jgi:hypothetical protein
MSPCWAGGGGDGGGGETSDDIRGFCRRAESRRKDDLVSNMGVETIIGSEGKGLGGDITGEAGWLNPSRATIRTMAALTHLLLVRLELLR